MKPTVVTPTPEAPVVVRGTAGDVTVTGLLYGPCDRERTEREQKIVEHRAFQLDRPSRPSVYLGR